MDGPRVIDAFPRRWRTGTAGWIFSLALVALVTAQENEPGVIELPTPNGEPVVAGESILTESEKLWLNERQGQIQAQIEHLLRIRATLGPKHPSTPQVLAELEALRSQLETWQISSDSIASEDAPLSDAFEEMTDADLRRLVLQMAIKIDRLETRIGVLERRQRQL